MAEHVDDPCGRFIERFARLVEEDGGPRIAGRIAALMLMTPSELSIEEIATRLRVSKASVSTNARLLEQWGALERVTRPGDRRDHYRVAEDAPVQILERRLDWMRRMRDAAEEGARAAACEPTVQARLDGFCGMHRDAIRTAERALSRLRRARRGEGGGRAPGVSRPISHHDPRGRHAAPEAETE
jgi:DNA-binding MarR family transcriptional regulator